MLGCADLYTYTDVNASRGESGRGGHLACALGENRLGHRSVPVGYPRGRPQSRCRDLYNRASRSGGPGLIDAGAMGIHRYRGWRLRDWSSGGTAAAVGCQDILLVLAHAVRGSRLANCMVDRDGDQANSREYRDRRHICDYLQPRAHFVVERSDRNCGLSGSLGPHRHVTQPCHRILIGARSRSMSEPPNDALLTTHGLNGASQLNAAFGRPQRSRGDTSWL